MNGALQEFISQYIKQVSLLHSSSTKRYGVNEFWSSRPIFRKKQVTPP